VDALRLQRLKMRHGSHKTFYRTTGMPKFSENPIKPSGNVLSAGTQTEPPFVMIAKRPWRSDP
jgi:hypothetical protein